MSLQFLYTFGIKEGTLGGEKARRGLVTFIFKRLYALLRVVTLKKKHFKGVLT